MITAPGVGSGLDINSLISQLVAAEGDAKTASLVGRRSDVETKISAYGGLKSALSGFQSSLENLKNVDTFTANKVTSGNPDVFSASVTGSSLAESNYDIQVQTLAESQRLISDGFADADAVVGTGSITIQVGTESFTIDIQAGSESLSDVRDAINSAEDNTGVTANLLNVDDGFGGTETKLIFTANETGTDNQITVTVSDDDLDNTDASGLSAFYYDTADATTPEQMSVANAAVDAVIFIDGQQVTSSSNTIASAIDGISLTLRDSLPGEDISLKVEQDTSQISNAVNTFVDRFNSLAGVISNLTVFDEATGASGALLGDVTLLTISSRIRQQLTDSVSGVTGDINTIVDIGITTNANGTISFDGSKLNDAIENDLDSVINLFTSDDGVATQLDSVLEEFVKSEGIVDSKVSGLNNTIEDIDDGLLELSERLELLEQKLTAQFSALDVLVARLNTTSSFLTQQLASISNITNNNSN